MSTVRISMPRRRWPLVVAAVLAGLVLLFTLFSGFVIDLLWYREIGQQEVFWITLRTKILLGVVFGALFAGSLYANVVIARRIRPQTRILTKAEEPLERIRDLADPLLRWLVPLGAVVLGIMVGVGVTGRWQEYQLWRHSAGVAFGHPEPLFGRDPAFYVFVLPWYRFLQSWLFSALVGITMIVGFAHVMWGGIRPQAPTIVDKVTPAARAHLSVLLGLIMLVKSWGYWLGRFNLLTSPRGVVEGASYTDVKAQLPALTFLTVVALICAVLFFVNIRVRQWSLPVISVGLLGLVSILLGTAYPSFVQQFRVKPNEQQYELPYIQYNIDATRLAFGLDGVQEQQRTIAGALTATQLADNATTVSNIRLWRGLPVLKDNFEAQQRNRQYYDFLDVDVDRYTIGGQPRVLMVSPREIAQNSLDVSGQTWQNRHLAYTHGFGAVAAQVNEATTEGQPIFTLQDLPPTGEPSMTQPRIYYGESHDVSFVVTGTSVTEQDYEGAPAVAPYSGTGGIPVGNFFTRALFAWRFRDYNLLASGTIGPSSKILIYRDLADRVPRPVPFLGFDNDKYFAIVDGQPTWIWDAYTTTDQYPYSQSVDVGQATDGLLGGHVNYMRNSVKAVVNAYDGSMTYYADLSEPIVQVWSRVFPGLFTDIATAPADLQAHFRYPENLFQVQATQFANYHVTDPGAFYRKSDFWQIPAEPADASKAPLRMRPYYQLLKLPGQSTESFQLVLPFVPGGDRPNMVAWLSAACDPGAYGQLTDYRFPEGRNIEGPSQVFSRINQDPNFSKDRSLLGVGGSTIIFGDFLVIPIDDSLLYVQPVYVQSDQTQAVPELKRVIVVNGNSGDVSVGTSLEEALAASVGGQVPHGGGGGGGGGTGTVNERIAALLSQAQVHYDAAQTALKAGDLGTYQREIDAAQTAVADAVALLGSDNTLSTGSPSPTPSTSPSP